MVKGNSNCSCGRGLSTINEITGRENDVLVTPYGEYLIGQNFTTYFKYFPSILQFQVVQDSINSLNLRFVVSDEFSLNTEKEIINEWNKRTNQTMIIKIEIVDNIRPQPSGKIQFLVRNPNVILFKQ